MLNEMLEAMNEMMKARAIADDDPSLGPVQPFPPEVAKLVAEYSVKYFDAVDELKRAYEEIFSTKKAMHRAIEMHMPELEPVEYRLTNDGRGYQIKYPEPQNTTNRQPDWAKEMMEEFKGLPTEMKDGVDWKGGAG